MKSTKTVLAVAIVIAGIGSFGCGGTDVAGQVDIAGVRRACDAFYTLFNGEPLTDSEFDMLIVGMEEFKDLGVPQSLAMQNAIFICDIPSITQGTIPDCLDCTTGLVDLVYP